jgi:hypothetical protein
MGVMSEAVLPYGAPQESQATLQRLCCLFRLMIALCMVLCFTLLNSCITALDQTLGTAQTMHASRHVCCAECMAALCRPKHCSNKSTTRHNPTQLWSVNGQ